MIRNASRSSRPSTASSLLVSSRLVLVSATASAFACCPSGSLLGPVWVPLGSRLVAASRRRRRSASSPWMRNRCPARRSMRPAADSFLTAAVGTVRGRYAGAGCAMSATISRSDHAPNKRQSSRIPSNFGSSITAQYTREYGARSLTAPPLGPLVPLTATAAGEQRGPLGAGDNQVGIWDVLPDDFH